MTFTRKLIPLIIAGMLSVPAYSEQNEQAPGFVSDLGDKINFPQ